MTWRRSVSRNKKLGFSIEKEEKILEEFLHVEFCHLDFTWFFLIWNCIQECQIEGHSRIPYSHGRIQWSDYIHYIPSHIISCKFKEEDESQKETDFAIIEINSRPEKIDSGCFIISQNFTNPCFIIRNYLWKTWEGASAVKCTLGKTLK